MSEQTGAARSFSDEVEDQGRARRSQPTTWRRFRRHRVAFVGLAILGLLSFAAVFAPYIARHHPLYVNLDKVTLSPRWEHKLGTDEAGRDLFARLIFGGRVSLSVGLVSAGITAAIGTVIGLVSGYAGRKVDNVLMRFTELVMTFPAFFLILILIALIGRNIFNIMFVIGLFGWPGLARLVRGQVLSIKEMDYVVAARALGGSDRRVIFVHIMPAILGYVAVAAMLTIAGAIITETSLSFIGFGIKLPTPSWGNMMTAAQGLHTLKHEPWIWAPPGIVISATVIAVNFVGDGLRDALDPRTRME